MSYDPIWGGPIIALVIAGAAGLWAYFSKRAFDKKYKLDRD